MFKMSSMEICCDLSQASVECITRVLPQRRTKIMEVRESNGVLHLRLYTECTDREEIKSWIQEFEDITKSSYSIRTTGNSAGRYVVFKRTLTCQHNTRSEKLYDISKQNRTRNTNCPAAISITLHAIKRRYQGKNKDLHLLRKDLPCEMSMTLTHNHSTGSADAFKYRKVASDVKERLLKLFHNGHSPATALETIKTEIYLCNDNPNLILADRSQCPDYMYCYHLYMKQFSKKYGPLDFNIAAKEFLKKRLDEYNVQMDGNSAQIIFNDSEYIICICPPLMKRVHKYIQSSSEIVFMDSSGTVDHDGSRIFVILTHSDCGGLPLAVIITSSESCDVIKMGFQLLKDILGDAIFGGNPDGPKIFITDDSLAEQAAITQTWTKSKCLLCIFHVLQSVWRWLVKGKNKIPQNQQHLYFEEFKSILYAKTADDSLRQYEIAKNHAVNHQNYANYLDSYWQRKEQWALAYRNNLKTKGNNTNNLSEAVMRLIKDKIFNRVKAFNVVQMVDFILTKFMQYYEIRLLDAANNRQRKNIFSETIKVPPNGLLEQIQILSNSVVIVPSATKEKLHYIVNMDALMCSCFQGNTGNICKHIDWACMLLYSEKYNLDIDNIHKRKIFYIIATGSDPPSNWLLPLWNQNESSTSSQVIHCFSSTSHSPSSVEIQQELPEDCVKRGQFAIETMKTIFTNFLEKNPTSDIADALEKMCKNTEKLRTTAAFLSSISNFALEYRRKNRRAKILIQPTAVSRRKTHLSGRSSHVGGRPRKSLENNLRKKKPHKISNH